MISGQRHSFPCPACSKVFTYWVADATAQPKIKCTFCAKESFPKGEPPAAPAPAPPAAPPAAAPTPAKA